MTRPRKRKPGRPRGSFGPPRPMRAVYMTDVDYAACQERARADGLAFSPWAERVLVEAARRG